MNAYTRTHLILNLPLPEMIEESTDITLWWGKRLSGKRDHNLTFTTDILRCEVGNKACSAT